MSYARPQFVTSLASKCGRRNLQKFIDLLGTTVEEAHSPRLLYSFGIVKDRGYFSLDFIFCILVNGWFREVLKLVATP